MHTEKMVNLYILKITNILTTIFKYFRIHFNELLH